VTTRSTTLPPTRGVTLSVLDADGVNDALTRMPERTSSAGIVAL